MLTRIVVGDINRVEAKHNAWTMPEEDSEVKRVSEEVYKLITENITDLVAMCDFEANFSYVSPSYRHVLGYKPQELLGKPIYQKVHPEDLQEIQGLIGEKYEVLEPASAVFRMQHKKGHYLWFESHGRIIFSPDRAPVGAVFDTREITDRKRMEEILKENEERLNSIIDVSFDGIVIHDQGKIIFSNEKAGRFVGYEAKELIGMRFIDLIVPEDREGVQRNIDMTIENPDFAIEPRERRIIRKDGEILDIENYSRPTVFQGKKARIIALRDITERKKAEKALQDSEERYRFITENATDILWTADFEGNFLFLSPAFETISGYTVEDSINSKIWDFLTPQSAQRTKEFLLKSSEMTNEEQDYGAVPNILGLEYLHKDGSTRQCEATVKTFRDGNGNPKGIIGIARDVTIKKKMEHQLQQAIKMQAIGTLAGGVAHDFNNLLMGVQGRASIMLMDMDSNHPHYEHLKGIEEYVKSAADLAKQLLGFAKIGKYEVKTTNPNDVLRKTVEMFGRTKKEIAVNIKYGNDVYPVDMDRGQIEQVFLNLLVNAWQSMPGGGNLFIETSTTTLGNEYVTSHQINPGHYVKISITDTGVGMDKVTQARIFEPFFTTKEMGRGTGLGLASAYGIIKNHNGIINVYSEEGRGTTFNIYLPASLKEFENEAEAKPVSLLKGSETILVVDDEKLITEVSRKMLEQLGYRVLIAESGQIALNIYKEKKTTIDLIILDMIMPQATGGETFDQLKKINDEVKVILASGYSLNDQAKEILARGCNGFLQKPFDMETLSQKLREVLG